MQARLFYTIKKEKYIPLILIKSNQINDNVSDFEKNIFTAQKFKGKYGEICLITDKVGHLNKVFVGLEDGDEAKAIAHAVCHLPEGCYFTDNQLEHSSLVNWSLAQYKFDRYKKSDTKQRTLVVNEEDLVNILQEVDSIFLVRDLINTPTNDMGPPELASIMETMADRFGAVFEQWVGDDLVKNNFPAIYAVGKAAECEPRLLHLTYGNPKDRSVALVGKGVCFDSGGLDIKPSAGMRLMKKDMGGAAQVLGLAQWLMSCKAPIYLQVWIPAVENAIGSRSYRPGDVICMRNGLTVEVDNTDAEGRLILADAMVRACEDKPDLLIDFATLTGAARAAVGTEIAAMFVNDDNLAKDISIAAEKVNDSVWRMPLFKEYAELLKSNVADLANSGSSPYAGAVTAALFLERFVDDGIPWIHFDIMAWNVSSKPGKPQGGEAMGIKAIKSYLVSGC